MTLKPTAEQQLIIDTARDSTQNLLVNARAGAAKTSTIEMIAAALPQTRILCLAFNKKIAMELQVRLPSNCDAATLNSIGHRAWRDFIGRSPSVFAGKCYQIMKEVIEEVDTPSDREALWENFRDILKAVQESKHLGYLPFKVHGSAKPLIMDESFFDLIEFAPNALERDVINEIIVRSFREAIKGNIDYDDQILCPTIMPASFPQYPLTMIDEAQDLSPINHMMLQKIVRKNRLIAVGDPCQPAGTHITIVDKPADRWNKAKLRQVSIEEVKIGDTVLGYNGEGAFMYDRKVEGITAKPFEGNLVDVIGEGLYSAYTPNHHCYANFSSLRQHYAVYLMRKGDSFRIGRCKMDYGNMGAGPIVRARAEKADSLWLLSVNDNETGAAMEEAWAQAWFGIPDLTFNGPNTNSAIAEQVYLDNFWKEFPAGALEGRAVHCLGHYGRQLAYPLWDKDADYFSLKRPIVVRACNLISGVLMLPYTGESKVKKEAWVPVEIGKTPYSGLVYSFTISDNHLYVADNLVTHNCQAIYGFRGASDNSMQEMQQRFDMKELYLTICFRSAQSIIEAARWRAPDMQWRPNAPEGEVRSLSEWGPALLQDGDAIICRNNAPLFSMAIELLRAKLLPELSSGDIIKGLLATMKKFGPKEMTQENALVELTRWEDAALTKTKNRARIHDQASCIRIFIEETETLGDAMTFLQDISQRSGRIKLMTGHKSKGLEFDRVWFLDQKLLAPKGQDRNLKYVIQTRARETLIYVESEGWKGDMADIPR